MNTAMLEEFVEEFEEVIRAIYRTNRLLELLVAVTIFPDSSIKDAMELLQRAYKELDEQALFGDFD